MEKQLRYNKKAGVLSGLFDTHDRLRTNSNRIDTLNIPERVPRACHQLWGHRASRCDAVFYGPIQSRTISTRLTAGDDFIVNGHLLVAEESAHAAREYSVEGKLVREIKLAFVPFSVVRSENGNTVICVQQSTVEVDPGDKITWSVDWAPVGITPA